MPENEPEVLHDDDNGKFYIPFPGKQAVLRYAVKPEEKTIEFQSIFVPPSLREDGLARMIIEQAYAFAESEDLQPTPPSIEKFLEKNSEHM
ncbi:MAG: GNAT family N-acetyltransferase [bacterium]